MEKLRNLSGPCKSEALGGKTKIRPLKHSTVVVFQNNGLTRGPADALLFKSNQVS